MGCLITREGGGMYGCLITREGGGMYGLSDY